MPLTMGGTICFVKAIPSEPTGAPTSTEDFINDAVGLDIFDTDKD
jgi:hypothetical protein